MNYIYRMTHISNIPHILKYGITHQSSTNANPAYVPIGDASIIDLRNTKPAKTVAKETFVPGDFIPFYFYARMPMLYNIQHGYKVKKVAPEEIVYLIVDLKPIIGDPTRQYFFSDAHAICHFAHFYGKESINNINQILDLNAIRNNEWGNEYMVKERKQAEFLVKGDIPMDYIAAMCCYNEKTKDKLLGMGVQCRIIVKPDAYY